MDNQLYHLEVKEGPEPGKVYKLTSVSMTIGRDPMVEITIDDPEVSRKHAQLIGTLSGYRIQDLGSTNGTFVDGSRLGGEPLELTIGQIISIGSGVVLEYQDVTDIESQPVTLIDTALSSPELVDLQEDPQLAAAKLANDEPIVEETGAGTEDAMDVTRIESQSGILPSDAESQEVIAQEETPTLIEEDQDSYESAEQYEAVVIPHQGEPGRSGTVNTGSDSRRLSTIIAAIILMIICCGCSFVLLMYYYGGDWLLRQIGWLA